VVTVGRCWVDTKWWEVTTATPCDCPCSRFNSPFQCSASTFSKSDHYETVLKLKAEVGWEVRSGKNDTLRNDEMRSS
jgi:hypothetical protein